MTSPDDIELVLNYDKMLNSNNWIAINWLVSLKWNINLRKSSMDFTLMKQ